MACDLRTNVQSWPEARQSFQQARQCLKEHESDISDITSRLDDLEAGGGGIAAAANSLYFEAFMKATSGIVYARLYNETLSAAVAGTTLSTSNTTMSLIRGTTAISLGTGNVYRPQKGKGGADAGIVNGARTVAVG